MKYGFIGCGNMGGAIAKALSKTTKDIILSGKSLDKAKKLAAELSVNFGTNEEVVKNSDAVFLAVKPQMRQDVIESLKALLLEKRPVIITMLAGTEIASLEEQLGEKLPIIRIMPNTPVAVGKGLILYCRNEAVSDEVLNKVVADLQPAGYLDEIAENLIDAGSLVSGCGPAYMYMLINALADGGVACGLPRDKALKYAELTMIGSGELAFQSDKHPEQLKDEVCSPGGSTIMGVKALEEGGFRNAAISAVLAAHKKTKELGK